MMIGDRLLRHLLQGPSDRWSPLNRRSGLSATLPNYLDVAQFLRVNPSTGLFFFDSIYRPVPLAQQYIGISEKDYSKRLDLFNRVCYDKVVESVKQGNQVMVFVHSRKDTGKTAKTLIDMAAYNEELELFFNFDHPNYSSMKVSLAVVYFIEKTFMSNNWLLS